MKVSRTSCGIAGTECSSLGRTVTVNEVTVVERFYRLANVRYRKNVAAGQKLLHARDCREVFINDAVEQGCPEPKNTDASLRDDTFQNKGIDATVRVDDQLGSVE